MTEYRIIFKDDGEDDTVITKIGDYFFYRIKEEAKELMEE